MPWSRREEEKKLLCDCQAPLLHRGPRLICPSAAGACGEGRRERRRKRGSHACPPPSQSLLSSSVSSLPGCLGGRAAAVSEQTVPSLSAGRDVPSLLRDGDAVRFHRVTPRPQRGGTLAHALHIAHAEAARAELAAMHRQHHSPVLPATYIGASRQERLLSPSEQHGPVYFLEAFQDALLQATLRSPLAPRRGVRMNGCSWSPPAFSTAACWHTALGTARGGWEAHAKPRGLGTGLPCSEPSALLSSGHPPSAG